jgi:HTH domain
MRGLSATPSRTSRDHCPPRQRGLGAMARRVAVDLTPQAVDQVASRVAQLLQRQRQSEPQLISAGELAHYLGVERPWIYKHCQLLGGQRIGDGPKAPWRFDRQTAMRALERHEAAQRTDGGL